jgi:hypothetical protein
MAYGGNFIFNTEIRKDGGVKEFTHNFSGNLFGKRLIDDQAGDW